RYYDPDLARWISEDPIEFNGGDLNLYRYVMNNPVNYFDPDGRYAWELGFAYNYANNNFEHDKTKHCYVSCVGASGFNPVPLDENITFILGIGKEVLDVIFKVNDKNEAWADFIANIKGLGHGFICPSSYGKPNENCKGFCESEYSNSNPNTNDETQKNQL
ncbi:MAG: RHS repeat-associated core domain-containing protein, partial [Oligoflexia bacterium]|nr:RHS repeat-associated core domain-containing protein [Oligoflexia bacterium]